jgi:hypothetical protein
VPVGRVVQVQLVLALDGGEALQRTELVGQGPDQGGLAGVLQPGDHDVLARQQRRPQEGRQRAVEGAEPDEVLQVDVPDPVAADDDVRAGRRPGHRRQPRGVLQPSMEVRGRGGEGALAGADPGGEELPRVRVDVGLATKPLGQEFGHLLTHLPHQPVVDVRLRRTHRAGRRRYGLRPGLAVDLRWGRPEPTLQRGIPPPGVVSHVVHRPVRT